MNAMTLLVFVTGICPGNRDSVHVHLGIQVLPFQKLLGWHINLFIALYFDHSHWQAVTSFCLLMHIVEVVSAEQRIVIFGEQSCSIGHACIYVVSSRDSQGLMSLTKVPLTHASPYMRLYYLNTIIIIILGKCFIIRQASLSEQQYFVMHSSKICHCLLLYILNPNFITHKQLCPHQKQVTTICRQTAVIQSLRASITWAYGASLTLHLSLPSVNIIYTYLKQTQ